jgi:hypothetical protein
MKRYDMECKIYREQYPRYSALPVPRDVWETPEYEAWADHVHDCPECSDWTLARQVEARGARVEDYPCVHIADRVTGRCSMHENAWDCPDIILVHDERFDEYGIPVRDGGSSMIVIGYCPWCGVKLPESQRDRWFAEIEALGIDPWSDEIPEPYRTNAWRK